MAFCSNCGKEIDSGAKFCPECGATVSNVNNHAQRKQVYDGEIHKCPNCGEVIDSFVARCPTCGFELNSKQVSTTLKEFIKEINECDRIIAANSQTSETGWTSWSKSKRFWWVFINIGFLCIPLVIYLVLPLIMLKSTPKLTPEEKRKVSLIENFLFPNDRESIISALVFAKEKIDFISKEKIDRKTAYWMRLWCAKAEQLKQKADILFPNDMIVNQSYAEILDDENRVNKKIKIEAIIGLVILIAAIIFAVFSYGIANKVGITGYENYDVTFEWPTNGLFAELPQPNSNNGKIVMETEYHISFDLYRVETADFENYVKECRKDGFTIDISMTDMSFYATDEDGCRLSIFYDDNQDWMKVSVSAYGV